MKAIRVASMGIIALSAVLTVGCFGGKSVERVSADSVKDLSGNWNDTDSRLVAEEMRKDIMSAPWLARARAAGKKYPDPTIIVGEIKNLSHEHIAVNTFIKDIEKEITNSNEASVALSKSERQEAREERKDQDTNASEASRKAAGQEAGADYMLKGEINTIIDAEGDTQVKFYQIDLTLASMADNRKVWTGQKKIKKVVEKSKLRF